MSGCCDCGHYRLPSTGSTEPVPLCQGSATVPVPQCQCHSASATVPVPQCQCHSASATVPVPQCSTASTLNCRLSPTIAGHAKLDAPPSPTCRQRHCRSIVDGTIIVPTRRWPVCIPMAQHRSSVSDVEDSTREAKTVRKKRSKTASALPSSPTPSCGILCRSSFRSFTLFVV
jgi:hypothetical protein